MAVHADLNLHLAVWHTVYFGCYVCLHYSVVMKSLYKSCCTLKIDKKIIQKDIKIIKQLLKQLVFVVIS